MTRGAPVFYLFLGARADILAPLPAGRRLILVFA